MAPEEADNRTRKLHPKPREAEQNVKNHVLVSFSPTLHSASHGCTAISSNDNEAPSVSIQKCYLGFTVDGSPWH